MRRVETYIGQQVYEWLFSAQAQQTMVGLAKLSAALLGTNAIVQGLPCTPTTPASMTVQIGKGEIYQMENLEATACGTLPADTTDQILKQGIQLATFTTTAFSAPVSTGQSINYLIEAQYQDQDISLDPTTGNAPVVLQFYNADSPQTPWSGPNNSGATSNTFRDGIVAYQIKAGIPATTGTQTTPSPDTGWVGLWVVTVAFGQTSITAGNIAQYSGAPVLPSGILQSIQSGNLSFGVDVGGVNAVSATFPVPSSTLTDNQGFWVKVANTNTGATTFTPNPGVISAAPVVGLAQVALQGGELVAGGRAFLVWRADISSYVLISCTGGALQVAPGTASRHAVQVGQLYGTVKGYVGFSSSQIWTSPFTGTAYLSGSGGGGGGGSNATTGANQTIGGAGGGGAGKPVIRAPISLVAGQSYIITIGAAGAPGNAGGTTAFDTLVTLDGGFPGFGDTAGAMTSYLSGALCGNGHPAGGYGQDTGPVGVGAASGAGASSPFGGGGGQVRGVVAGNPMLPGQNAGGFGAGGSGAGGAYAAGNTTAPATTGAAGGSGSQGFLFLEW